MINKHALIHYLLKCKIVLILKRFGLHNKRNTKPHSATSVTNVNVLNIITNEINTAKQQFSGRTIITQNIKKLPLIETHSDRSTYTAAFTLAFNHILHNACSHTNADAPIIVIGERKASKIFISILDYGQGIPEEKIEKILNSPAKKVTSLHKSIKANTNTQKLGLPIAKQAIESIGGSLTLKNHKKIGLIVTLGL